MMPRRSALRSSANPSTWRASAIGVAPPAELPFVGRSLPKRVHQRLPAPDGLTHAQNCYAMFAQALMTGWAGNAAARPPKCPLIGLAVLPDVIADRGHCRWFVMIRRVWISHRSSRIRGPEKRRILGPLSNRAKRSARTSNLAPPPKRSTDDSKSYRNGVRPS
jgi:hypothetical protein